MVVCKFFKAMDFFMQRASYRIWYTSSQPKDRPKIEMEFFNKFKIKLWETYEK